MREMWKWFCSNDFATTIGFYPSHDCLQATETEGDDRIVANAAFRLLNLYFGESHMAYLHFTLLPPGVFMGLASPDATIVSATLAKCKATWELLENMEKAALTNKALAAFISDLCFPREQFCRETFVALAEAKFEVVPSWMFSDMKEFASSWRSSLLCENLFRSCRMREKAAASHHNGHLTI